MAATCRFIFGCCPAKYDLHHSSGRNFSNSENLMVSAFLIQVVNTTSEELSDIAVEVSAWDLNGACSYSMVVDKLSVPAKRTVRTVEMDYPKSKAPEPVYFLLLKLHNMSDNGILSRNFYWLHLPGGDYKPLEAFRRKKVPLKITSLAYIRGSTYEIDMHVQNTSKVDTKKLNLIAGPKCPQKPNRGLLCGISTRFFKEAGDSRTTVLSGTDPGVAFFLNFSVHGLTPDHKKGEDTRILPVHYSDNYFSLVPGEATTVKLTFKVPPGVAPRVALTGWNHHHEGHTVFN